MWTRTSVWCCNLQLRAQAPAGFFCKTARSTPSSPLHSCLPTPSFPFPTFPSFPLPISTLSFPLRRQRTPLNPADRGSRERCKIFQFRKRNLGVFEPVKRVWWVATILVLCVWAKMFLNLRESIAYVPGASPLVSSYGCPWLKAISQSL